MADELQPPFHSPAERLGHPPGAKLLIVHADDLGLTHSVNAASIQAFETGLVNSGSIMVPCPWFPEIAAYARRHPEADLGLHITLTSERPAYRWGPVLPKDRVPTLLDPHGYLRQSWIDPGAIEPREAEAEIRAQLEQARAFGIEPTHLDSHQFKLYRSGPALFDRLLQVAREQKLPVLIAKDWLAQAPSMRALLGPEDVVIDRAVMIPELPAERWGDFYAGAIRNLPPGITEFIVHLGHDDAEMRAFSSDRPSWGAAWRQRDFEFFTSERFRGLLQDNDVKLVTWREIGGLLACARAPK